MKQQKKASKPQPGCKEDIPKFRPLDLQVFDPQTYLKIGVKGIDARKKYILIYSNCQDNHTFCSSGCKFREFTEDYDAAICTLSGVEPTRTRYCWEVFDEIKSLPMLKEL